MLDKALKKAKIEDVISMCTHVRILLTYIHTYIHRGMLDKALKKAKIEGGTDTPPSIRGASLR